MTGARAVVTMNLAGLDCGTLPSHHAMDAAEIEAHLRLVPGWKLAADLIEREYRFVDFDAAMAFVNAVADIARAQDHHPTMVVGYNRCTLRFNTHSVAGVSIKDFICAAKADALKP